MKRKCPRFLVLSYFILFLIFLWVFLFLNCGFNRSSFFLSSPLFHAPGFESNVKFCDDCIHLPVRPPYHTCHSPHLVSELGDCVVAGVVWCVWSHCSQRRSGKRRRSCGWWLLRNYWLETTSPWHACQHLTSKKSEKWSMLIFNDNFLDIICLKKLPGYHLNWTWTEHIWTLTTKIILTLTLWHFGWRLLILITHKLLKPWHLQLLSL